MKKYVIGVDSGGTSTVADAYDLNGNLLLSAKAGFGNLLINQEIGLKNLKQSVDEILSILGMNNCRAIVFGIAGVESGNYKQTVLDTFLDYSADIVVLNDAWLAYYALLNGQDGCLVISGTGSIAIGHHLGVEERVGGWGNLLGDEGSGYDIAKKLISSVLNAYDENRSTSKLEQKLLDKLNFNTPFELVRFVNSSSKDQIAKLSLLISDEANNNDNQAIDILKNAGIALANQTVMLLNKLKIEGEKKIAVTGNVLLKNDFVYEAFKKEVLKNFRECEFIRKKIPNTIGGYYYFNNNL